MEVIPGEEGDSHMKEAGTLRGVNFGFWSHLGGLGKATIFYATKVLFSSFKGQNLLKPHPDWFPLGATNSLTHTQMVSFRG